MANETQTITFNRVPDAGEWALRFDGDDTAPLAFDASASDVSAALGALASMGDPSNAPDVSGTVAGGFSVSFVHGFAGVNVPELEVASSTLVQGATDVAADTITPGAPSVQEQQTITLTGAATAGTFSLSGSVPIALTADGATVQAALQGTPPTLAVTASGTSGGPWVATWDDPGGPQTLITVDDSALTKTVAATTITVDVLTPGDESTQEVQRITLADSPDAGEWYYTSPFTGNLGWDASAAEVQTVLTTVMGGFAVTVTGSDGGPWTVTWDDPGAQASLAGALSGWTLSKTVSGAGNTVIRATMGSDGAAEVQRLTLTDGPDGGSWEPTGAADPVDWDASAAEVQSSLRAALGVPVTVTGSDGGPYDVTWPETGDAAALTPDGGDLTRSVSITVVTIEDGSSSGGPVTTVHPGGFLAISGAARITSAASAAVNDGALRFVGTGFVR